MTNRGLNTVAKKSSNVTEKGIGDCRELQAETRSFGLRKVELDNLHRKTDYKCVFLRLRLVQVSSSYLERGKKKEKKKRKKKEKKSKAVSVTGREAP
jgi:hypothetical protein